MTCLQLIRDVELDLVRDSVIRQRGCDDVVTAVCLDGGQQWQSDEQQTSAVCDL